MPAMETLGEISTIFCVTMDTSVINQAQISLRGASLQCVFAVNDESNPSIQVAFGQAVFTFPGKCSLSQAG